MYAISNGLDLFESKKSVPQLSCMALVPRLQATRLVTLHLYVVAALWIVEGSAQHLHAGRLGTAAFRFDGNDCCRILK